MRLGSGARAKARRREAGGHHLRFSGLENLKLVPLDHATSAQRGAEGGTSHGQHRTGRERCECARASESGTHLGGAGEDTSSTASKRW